MEAGEDDRGRDALIALLIARAAAIGRGRIGRAPGNTHTREEDESESGGEGEGESESEGEGEP
jgi:hypothetical protein